MTLQCESECPPSFPSRLRLPGCVLALRSTPLVKFPETASARCRPPPGSLPSASFPPLRPLVATLGNTRPRPPSWQKLCFCEVPRAPTRHLPPETERGPPAERPCSGFPPPAAGGEARVLNKLPLHCAAQVAPVPAEPYCWRGRVGGAATPRKPSPGGAEGRPPPPISAGQKMFKVNNLGSFCLAAGMV